jgi:hypothetical protein
VLLGIDRPLSGCLGGKFGGIGGMDDVPLSAATTLKNRAGCGILPPGLGRACCPLPGER